MTMPPRRPPHAQIDWRPTPMVTRLLIANVVLWVGFSALIFWIEFGFAYEAHKQLRLTPFEAATGHVYQVFSYMWLHDLNDASHLIFNMLGLYFLGPTLERRWGGRSFLRYYLLAGVFAGIFTVVAGLIFQETFGHTPVLGASGAVLALLAAYSLVMPRMRLLLMFVIPVQARWLIPIAIAIDSLMFFGSSASRVAFHTHLGGILAAWLLIRGYWRPSLALDTLRLWRLERRKRRTRSQLKVIKGGKDGRKDLH